MFSWATAIFEKLFHSPSFCLEICWDPSCILFLSLLFLSNKTLLNRIYTCWLGEWSHLIVVWIGDKTYYFKLPFAMIGALQKIFSFLICMCLTYIQYVNVLMYTFLYWIVSALIDWNTFFYIKYSSGYWERIWFKSWFSARVQKHKHIQVIC